MMHRTRTPMNITLFPRSIGFVVAAIVGMLVTPFTHIRAEEAADTDPVVSVTVNGTRAAEVFRGMPLTVRGVFVHPDIFTSGALPILLSAGTAPWTDAIMLPVIDSNGMAQT